MTCSDIACQSFFLRAVRLVLPEEPGSADERASAEASGWQEKGQSNHLTQEGERYAVFVHGYFSQWVYSTIQLNIGFN